MPYVILPLPFNHIWLEGNVFQYPEQLYGNLVKKYYIIYLLSLAAIFLNTLLQTIAKIQYGTCQKFVNSLLSVANNCEYQDNQCLQSKRACFQ